MRMMNGRSVFIWSCFFATLVFFMAFFYIGVNNQKKIMVTAIGEVVTLHGKMIATSVDNTTRHLKEHSTIFPKDTLSTHDKSFAAVHFTDGTLIVMQPNTILKINTYHFASPSVSKDDNFKLILNQGGIQINAGKVARTNSSTFQILSPVGSVELENPKASIAYEPMRGMAFKGTGVIKNSKGVEILISNGFGYVDNRTMLPINSASFLIASYVAFESRITEMMTQSLSIYGENKPYSEIATAKFLTSQAELAKEDVLLVEKAEVLSNDSGIVVLDDSDIDDPDDAPVAEATSDD